MGLQRGGGGASHRRLEGAGHLRGRSRDRRHHRRLRGRPPGAHAVGGGRAGGAGEAGRGRAPPPICGDDWRRPWGGPRPSRRIDWRRWPAARAHRSRAPAARAGSGAWTMHGARLHRAGAARLSRRRTPGRTGDAPRCGRTVPSSGSRRIGDGSTTARLELRQRHGPADSGRAPSSRAVGRSPELAVPAGRAGPRLQPDPAARRARSFAASARCTSGPTCA